MVTSGGCACSHSQEVPVAVPQRQVEQGLGESSLYSPTCSHRAELSYVEDSWCLVTPPSALCAIVPCTMCHFPCTWWYRKTASFSTCPWICIQHKCVEGRGSVRVLYIIHTIHTKWYVRGVEIRGFPYTLPTGSSSTSSVAHTSRPCIRWRFKVQVACSSALCYKIGLFS